MARRSERLSPRELTGRALGLVKGWGPLGVAIIRLIALLHTEDPGHH